MTDDEPKPHLITWETRNQKWYLDSWTEKPYIFKWCKQRCSAQAFESGDLAMVFAIDHLGSRKVEFEEVELEDFGIIFDIG